MQGAGTCELQLADGQLVEPERFARHLDQARLGARLRGVEITVDGRLERRDGQLLLRVRRQSAPLQIMSLQTKIQLDAVTKRPQRPNRAERRRLAALKRSWDGIPREVRLTGPLVQTQSGLVLQLRQFDLNPSTLEESPP